MLFWENETLHLKCLVTHDLIHTDYSLKPRESRGPQSSNSLLFSACSLFFWYRSGYPNWLRSNSRVDDFHIQFHSKTIRPRENSEAKYNPE